VIAALPASIASAVSFEIFWPPTRICVLPAAGPAAACGAGSSWTSTDSLRPVSWRAIWIFLGR
jgi:hypothetical protein